MIIKSAQNRSISSEIWPENSQEIGRFFTDCFLMNLASKILENLSVKISRNLTSATYQKPCSMARSIRSDCLKISRTEVGINLEVNWLCLCDLAHFYGESKAR